jgi:endo-1,4-beta-xylanase
MVTAARNAGLKMHGHTLIWHQQSPVWLAAGGEAYLNKFVTDVAAHFKGKLISWDVVNEAMREGLTPADTANWKNCLRKDDLPGQSGSPWNRVIGPDYIEKAFLAARAADPEVKLFYNDYNLNNANKAQAVYNMVRDINIRYPNEGGRKLIDGIGMQTHHHVYTDPNTVDASITLFASLGVDITVSEMDIQASGTFGTNAITWGDSAAGLQAKQYAAMFRIFKKHASKISRVTFWGLDDRTSWRANTYPTLLDKDYGLKPAFLAVSDPGQY